MLLEVPLWQETPARLSSQALHLNCTAPYSCAGMKTCNSSIEICPDKHVEDFPVITIFPVLKEITGSWLSIWFVEVEVKQKKMVLMHQL